MPPGVRPVILHPHVVDGFVLPTILHNLSGSNVAHGESFYEKAQFGSDALVFREDLSLRLDPLRPLRSGSYRFTSEGVPAARHTYIRQGRLVSPILDLKYESFGVAKGTTNRRRPPSSTGAFADSDSRRRALRG